MNPEPVAAPATGEPPGGPSLQMVRPHLRDLPRVPFPAGFGIRPMRRDEAGLWTDIERDAEPYVTITDELFMQQFGDDLPAVERRCFIVTGPRGIAVGTISAWYTPSPEGQDRGRIHWLAIRPAWQRRGLARAALSHAMARLAEWHERAFLVTSAARLGAVRLYLDFGFVPDMTAPDADRAWRQVALKLDHPALAPFRSRQA